MHEAAHVRLLDDVFADFVSSRALLLFWLVLGMKFLFTISFAAAVLARTSLSMQRSAGFDYCLLVLQILIGLAFHPGFLYIVALELALVLPCRAALIWLAAQMLALGTVMITYVMFTPNPLLRCYAEGTVLPSETALVKLELFDMLAWQLLTFCVGYVAAAEKRSRIKLAGAHAELLATQQLLADALRASERGRIAHTLHDALGRHLGALNAHLDHAAMQVDRHVSASVDTSRELAQRLLAEVGDAVSTDRPDEPIDLLHALNILCAGIPFPRIVLEFDDAPEIHSPSLAHTIFCAVQEAITNAVRHAGAGMLRIVFSRQGTGMVIDISDNGKGGYQAEGNGLRGIRERVEEFGGTLTIGRPRAGFSLQIVFPGTGSAA